MTDAFFDAISTDDSPAPEPTDAHRRLLGDPPTEGNEHLLDGLDAAGTDDADAAPTDDLHEDLNNADIQN